MALPVDGLATGSEQTRKQCLCKLGVWKLQDFLPPLALQHKGRSLSSQDEVLDLVLTAFQSSSVRHLLSLRYPPLQKLSVQLGPHSLKSSGARIQSLAFMTSTYVPNHNTGKILLLLLLLAPVFAWGYSNQ